MCVNKSYNESNKARKCLESMLSVAVKVDTVAINDADGVIEAKVTPTAKVL